MYHCLVYVIVILYYILLLSPRLVSHSLENDMHRDWLARTVRVEPSNIMSFKTYIGPQQSVTNLFISYDSCSKPLASTTLYTSFTIWIYGRFFTYTPKTSRRSNSPPRVGRRCACPMGYERASPPVCSQSKRAPLS